MNSKRLELFPLRGFPIVQPGDDVPNLIASVIKESGFKFQQGDIIVVTHTIVSIAENKLQRLAEVIVSDKAKEMALSLKRAQENVEVALQQAKDVLREGPVLITRTEHGIITDYSGVDESNAPPGTLVTLPDDPNMSAKEISKVISRGTGFNVPVIITDTQGRPWRKGAVNLAIGVAGMSPFTQNAGKEDIYGRELRSSMVCIADQMASAAELLMGQANEGVPVVIVRGVEFDAEGSSTSQIIRPDSESLFD
ncbi:MAG: coenzyme F420-0:L-glutamate ligase [Candidatus Thorarchaeota archaeon]